jgi:hypothetical protein
MAITVREVDGSPSVASVTILEFDQTDGFILTQTGGDRIRIDLPPSGGSSLLADWILGG